MQPERDGRLLTARVVPSSTPPGQDQVDAAPVREAEQRGEQRHAEGTEGRYGYREVVGVGAIGACRHLLPVAEAVASLSASSGSVAACAATAGRPDVLGDRTSLTLHEGMLAMLENTFMNVKNRSSRITAELDISTGGAHGAILSQGGRFGGWSLFMKDGKPACTYNFLGLARYTVASPEAPPPGPATVPSTSPMTGADSARAGRRLST